MKLSSVLFILVLNIGYCATSKSQLNFYSKLLDSYNKPLIVKQELLNLTTHKNNNEEAIKSFFILSEIEHSHHNYKASLNYLSKAIDEKESNTNQNYLLSSLIYLRLADKCRIFGLTDQANKFYKKANLISYNTKHEKEYSLYLFYKASFIGKKYLEKGIYKSAIDSLEKARRELIKNKTSPIFIIKIQNLIGDAYRLMGDEQNARRNFEITNSFIKENSNRLSCDQLYAQLSERYLRLKSTITLNNYNALINCDKDYALRFHEIANELYKTTSTPTLENEHSNMIQYIHLEEIKSKRAARSLLLSIIEKSQGESTDKKGFLTYWLAIVLVIIIALVIVYYFYHRKVKENYLQFETLLQQPNNKQNITINENKYVIEENKSNIPKKTVNQILQGLSEFESSKNFLRSDLSIDKLSKQLNSNSKYLSEVINSVKQKNYNTYINELRINYIIKKMQEEPEFLKYKVSYLAKITGFSSHSAFTTVFKSVTQLTPKQFISFLKKDTQQDSKAK